MEEEPSGSLPQSSEKSEFQMRIEDFPTLRSTWPSENEPNRVMSESSGVMSEPSRIMSDSIGIMSGPNTVMCGSSGIMSGSSGIASGPSGIVSGPSGIAMPAEGTSSLQMGDLNVGAVPDRPRPHFFQGSQPEPRMNIQMFPDGTVTNIPPTMMADQFGMIGLLAAHRGMQHDPKLTTLTVGEDPVNMGLGMNSNLEVLDPSGRGRREIYQNYGGPWANEPNNAPNIETRIPEEYRTRLLLGNKLAPIKFPLLDEDVLFYIFYNYPNEQYQIAAAYELYGRDWRYHKVERLWVRRLNLGSIVERTTTFERGTYNAFDPAQWRKTPKEMTLQYEDLERRPTIPPDMRIFFER